MADVDQAVTFVDPDGLVHVLTGGDVEVEFGVEGRFMPPVRSVLDQIPGQPGARRRETSFGVREVVVPVRIFGSSQAALRANLRAMVSALNPTRGDGVLRATAPDGVTREIRCRYAAGLEVVEAEELIGGAQRAGLVFLAADPFWYDTAPSSSSFTTGMVAGFLGDPFLPLRLASDTVLGEQTVTNDGDVETWPVWTIAGPATSIALENVTTGLRLDLPVELAAGQSVIIDTRPFRKTVRREDGTNLYGDLAAGSALWPLIQGANVVRAELPGSTGDTFVTLVYSRRWLSA